MFNSLLESCWDNLGESMKEKSIAIHELKLIKQNSQERNVKFPYINFLCIRQREEETLFNSHDSVIIAYINRYQFQYFMWSPFSDLA